MLRDDSEIKKLISIRMAMEGISEQDVEAFISFLSRATDKKAIYDHIITKLDDYFEETGNFSYDNTKFHKALIAAIQRDPSLNSEIFPDLKSEEKLNSTESASPEALEVIQKIIDEMKNRAAETQNYLAQIKIHVLVKQIEPLKKVNLSKEQAKEKIKQILQEVVLDSNVIVIVNQALESLQLPPRVSQQEEEKTQSSSPPPPSSSPAAQQPPIAAAPPPPPPPSRGPQAAPTTQTPPQSGLRPFLDDIKKRAEDPLAGLKSASAASPSPSSSPAPAVTTSTASPSITRQDTLPTPSPSAAAPVPPPPPQPQAQPNPAAAPAPATTTTPVTNPEGLIDGLSLSPPARTLTPGADAQRNPPIVGTQVGLSLAELKNHAESKKASYGIEKLASTPGNDKQITLEMINKTKVTATERQENNQSVIDYAISPRNGNKTKETIEHVCKLAVEADLEKRQKLAQDGKQSPEPTKFVLTGNNDEAVKEALAKAILSQGGGYMNTPRPMIIDNKGKDITDEVIAAAQKPVLEATTTRPQQ